MSYPVRDNLLRLRFKDNDIVGVDAETFIDLEVCEKRTEMLDFPKITNEMRVVNLSCKNLINIALNELNDGSVSS